MFAEMFRGKTVLDLDITVCQGYVVLFNAIIRLEFPVMGNKLASCSNSTVSALAYLLHVHSNSRASNVR